MGSEVVLDCAILNRMTALGRPASYRLGALLHEYPLRVGRRGPYFS